jgi:hypothetical protein
MRKTTACAALVLLAVCGTSDASTFEGVIKKVQINPGTSPVRVSIWVDTHISPCAHQNWYAFENGDTALGKTWTAAVLAAHAAGKTVVTTGTGTCDSYGVETVSVIQVK